MRNAILTLLLFGLLAASANPAAFYAGLTAARLRGNADPWTIIQSWAGGTMTNATYARGPSVAEANYAFTGGVLLPSGKVVLVPRNADYVGIYDPVANTYTRGPSMAAEGGAAFFGGVLLPSGKVALVPYNADYVGIYDPVANTYARGPSMAAEGDLAFLGGVLLPSGKVVLVPVIADYVGIVAPQPLTAADKATCESAYLNKF
jgi:hypothetical protein